MNFNTCIYFLKNKSSCWSKKSFVQAYTLLGTAVYVSGVAHALLILPFFCFKSMHNLITKALPTC